MGLFNLKKLARDKQALDVAGIHENQLSRLVPTTEFFSNCHQQWAHHHDDGRPSNLEASNKAWFEDWVTGFELAQLEDRFYQLGVFRKSDGAHVGKIEVYTILRMDYDWGMLGYSIHNQHWRKGYGSEAVQAAL